MPWPFTKKINTYALVGNHQGGLLAVKGITPTGAAAATPLGWSERPPVEAKSIHQLMASVTNPRGNVAISLPLDQFEVLNLTINKVPREVVAKILPYHINKIIETPLADFIYDWQVSKELKDSLQLNVFLFPAQIFQEMRSTLNHYRLNPVALEPDVFSACAFLESRRRLPHNGASLIVLLWPASVSIAIYDNKDLSLTRDVNLKRPVQEDDNSTAAEGQRAEEEINGPVMPAAEDPLRQDDSLFDPSSDDLLANFLVATKEDRDDSATAASAPETDVPPPPASRPEPRPTNQNWATYINQVSLELMRTRDYFNAVIKGNQIKTAFIGGGEAAWQPLAAELAASLDITVQDIMENEQASFDNNLFEAISTGVLS